MVATQPIVFLGFWMAVRFDHKVRKRLSKTLHLSTCDSHEVEERALRMISSNIIYGCIQIEQKTCCLVLKVKNLALVQKIFNSYLFVLVNNDIINNSEEHLTCNFFWKYSETRKSFCVNARGIPPAAHSAVLFWRGTPSWLAGGTPSWPDQDWGTP